MRLNFYGFQVIKSMADVLDLDRQARSLISLASIHHIEKAKMSAERKAVGLPPEQSLFVDA